LKDIFENRIAAVFPLLLINENANLVILENEDFYSIENGFKKV